MAACVLVIVTVNVSSGSGIESNENNNFITFEFDVGEAPITPTDQTNLTDIYAIGGLSGSISGSPYLNIVEKYDPETDTWSTVASMPTARTGLAAVSQ